MLLSYSTRGWYDLPFPQLLNAASEMKFSGIEFYDFHKHPEFLEGSSPLSKSNIEATLRQFRDDNISIVCMDTSLDLTKEASEEFMIWTVKKPNF